MSLADVTLKEVFLADSYEAEVDRLKARIKELEAERDEADRRAGQQSARLPMKYISSRTTRAVAVNGLMIGSAKSATLGILITRHSMSFGRMLSPL